MSECWTRDHQGSQLTRDWMLTIYFLFHLPFTVTTYHQAGAPRCPVCEGHLQLLHWLPEKPQFANKKMMGYHQCLQITFRIQGERVSDHHFLKAWTCLLPSSKNTGSSSPEPQWLENGGPPPNSAPAWGLPTWLWAGRRVSSPVMGNQDLRGISPHVTGLPPPDPDQLFTHKLPPAACSGLTLTFHILRFNKSNQWSILMCVCLNGDP